MQALCSISNLYCGQNLQVTHLLRNARSTTRTVWKVRLGVYSPLAQSVERLFYMQDVVGSNPTGTTIIAVLAQLGERFLDVEEVTGSIPVDCTNENMRLSRRLAAFSKKAVAIKKTSAQQIG